MCVTGGRRRMRRICSNAPGWEMGEGGRASRYGMIRSGALRLQISYCNFANSMGRAGTGPCGREVTWELQGAAVHRHILDG